MTEKSISTVRFLSEPDRVHFLNGYETACGLKAGLEDCGDAHVCHGNRPAEAVTCEVCRVRRHVSKERGLSLKEAVEWMDGIEAECLANCPGATHKPGCEFNRVFSSVYGPRLD